MLHNDVVHSVPNLMEDKNVISVLYLAVCSQWGFGDPIHIDQELCVVAQ